jgi:hypothetical protein
MSVILSFITRLSGVGHVQPRLREFVLFRRLWLSPAQFLAGLLLPALAVTKMFTEGLLALCVLGLELGLATLKTSAAAPTIRKLRRQLITA